MPNVLARVCRDCFVQKSVPTTTVLGKKESETSWDKGRLVSSRKEIGGVWLRKKKKNWESGARCSSPRRSFLGSAYLASEITVRLLISNFVELLPLKGNSSLDFHAISVGQDNRKQHTR